MRRAFGLGLKKGKEGIQGELQIWIFSPFVMDQQTLFSTIILFFNNPFQIQEDKGFEGASKKERPFYKYFPLRASTQRRGSLKVNFQPSWANKELLRHSIELIPSPPKLLGLQILSEERKEMLCFFSCGKPYQNFLKTKSIFAQKVFGIWKRHNVSGNGI